MSGQLNFFSPQTEKFATNKYVENVYLRRKSTFLTVNTIQPERSQSMWEQSWKLSISLPYGATTQLNSLMASVLLGAQNFHEFRFWRYFKNSELQRPSPELARASSTSRLWDLCGKRASRRPRGWGGSHIWDCWNHLWASNDDGLLWDKQRLFFCSLYNQVSFLFTGPSILKVFCIREGALKAIENLDRYEIRPGKMIGVKMSVDNRKLFISGLDSSITVEIIRVTISKCSFFETPNMFFYLVWARSSIIGRYWRSNFPRWRCKQGLLHCRIWVSHGCGTGTPGPGSPATHCSWMQNSNWVGQSSDERHKSNVRLIFIVPGNRRDILNFCPRNDRRWCEILPLEGQTLVVFRFFGHW